MDIQRPASVAQGKKRKQIMFGVVGLVVIALVSVFLARLQPAAPTVERATVWVDTVKRGPMLRQVRGLGTLVPVDEARRWVPASTQGRVERIVLRPGVQVTPDTIVLELSDPQVQQALNDADQQLRASEADFNSLKARLDAETLNQRAQAAIVRADFQNAQTEREMNEGLAKDGLVSNLVLRQSVVRAESLKTRDSIETDRLKVSEAERPRATGIGAGPGRSAQVEPGPAASAGRSAARARRHVGRARAGAGRSGPAGRAGHEPGARGRSDAPEGRVADCGDAGART